MSVPLVSTVLGDAALRRTSERPKVCVGIATKGRPAILKAVIGHLAHQTLRPESIIVACTGPDDVGELDDRPDVTVLMERPGLARQRNAILRHIPDDTDVIAFFDDDFVPDPNWIGAATDALMRNPSAACVTGHVVLDGIKGPGIAFHDACAALETRDMLPDVAGSDILESYSPYGCNMAFRVSAIHGRCFDERLVLYGWLEDRDFGGALSRDGWGLLKVAAARGVHMGDKNGRVAGHRLGYSQVMNPFYLRRKGTMTWSSLVDHIFRNVTSNVLGSLSPEPYIDRRGRLKGNVIAFADLLRGHLTPERAEKM